MPKSSTVAWSVFVACLCLAGCATSVVRVQDRDGGPEDYEESVLEHPRSEVDEAVTTTLGELGVDVLTESRTSSSRSLQVRSLGGAAFTIATESVVPEATLLRILVAEYHSHTAEVTTRFQERLEKNLAMGTADPPAEDG